MTAVGQRVRLIRCTDPYTRIQPGTEGEVVFVDALGSLHVRWDDGSNLGLIPGQDSWETVETKEEADTT